MTLREHLKQYEDALFKGLAKNPPKGPRRPTAETMADTTRTRRIKDALRELLNRKRDATNDELWAELVHRVNDRGAKSSFDGHLAPAIRRELGIDATRRGPGKPPPRSEGASRAA